jgi:hypothetical protein
LKNVDMGHLPMKALYGIRSAPDRTHSCNKLIGTHRRPPTGLTL